MTKTNWVLMVLIFLAGIGGLVVGGDKGIKEGYDSGYQDGFKANPNYGYINYGNDSLETGKSFTVTTPQDNSQSELAQQIMDFLGQASKVDISIKGDKNTGGSIDIHLEFDK